MLTFFAVTGLILLAILLFLAACNAYSEGGFLGFFAGWQLMDAVGSILALIATILGGGSDS